MIPEILKNKNYLNKVNIGIFDLQGKPISVHEWTQKKALEYKYIQKPSPENALGVVKLDFPNKFAVYLHDTNHRDLFGLTNRALSSGCVRVENPLPLAAYLVVDENKWSNERINETLKSEKTTYIKPNQAVSVHLLYWTAWSKQGKLLFRNDIYNLDAELYKRLQN